MKRFLLAAALHAAAMASLPPRLPLHPISIATGLAAAPAALLLPSFLGPALIGMGSLGALLLATDLWIWLSGPVECGGALLALPRRLDLAPHRIVRS